MITFGKKTGLYVVWWLYLVMRLQPERLQLGVTIFLVGELVVLQNIVHLPEVACHSGFVYCLFVAITIVTLRIVSWLVPQID